MCSLYNVKPEWLSKPQPSRFHFHCASTALANKKIIKLLFLLKKNNINKTLTSQFSNTLEYFEGAPFAPGSCRLKSSRRTLICTRWENLISFVTIEEDSIILIACRVSWFRRLVGPKIHSISVDIVFNFFRFIDIMKRGVEFCHLRSNVSNLGEKRKTVVLNTRWVENV